jgi:hypothetical protein
MPDVVGSVPTLAGIEILEREFLQALRGTPTEHSGTVTDDVGAVTDDVGNAMAEPGFL